MSRAEALSYAFDHREFSLRGVLRALLIVTVVAVALLFLEWLLRADTVPVTAISFEGEFNHVSKQELERAALPNVRGNFLLLDLDRVKASVESLPWVYRAAVERRWPGRVHIRFEEQHLVARWDAGVWLNRDGERVDLGTADAADDLPVLDGPEGTETFVLKQYLRFASILAPAGLTIKALHHSDRRTWALTLDNGLHVVLDKDAPHYRLERFARAYRQALADYGPAVAGVDLRYTNGFAVRWAAGTEPGTARHGQGGATR